MLGHTRLDKFDISKVPSDLKKSSSSTVINKKRWRKKVNSQPNRFSREMTNKATLTFLAKYSLKDRVEIINKLYGPKTTSASSLRRLYKEQGVSFKAVIREKAKKTYFRH